MIHALLASLLGTITFLVTSTSLGAVVLWSGGLFCPACTYRCARGRRLGAFNRQLSDTSGLMANSMRSGYSLLQAMEMVAREGPSPTAEEFQRVDTRGGPRIVS